MSTTVARASVGNGAPGWVGQPCAQRRQQAHAGSDGTAAARRRQAQPRRQGGGGGAAALVTPQRRLASPPPRAQHSLTPGDAHHGVKTALTPDPPHQQAGTTHKAGQRAQNVQSSVRLSKAMCPARQCPQLESSKKNQGCGQHTYIQRVLLRARPAARAARCIRSGQDPRTGQRE